MSSNEMRRTRLGPHRNEGARQAWLAMQKLGLDQSTLRARIREQTGVSIGSGLLVRHLYCDRRPGTEASESYRQVLGVDPLDWFRDPTGDFALPATRRPDEALPTGSAA